MLGKDVEARQVAGTVILTMVGFYLIFHPLSLLTDWDRMLGLCLAAGIGFAVPRPWMPVTLRFIAVYFVAMTIRWFPWQGRVNFKNLPIEFAFVIAAVSLWVSANLASQRPPEPPDADMFDDEPSDPSISAQSTG